MRRNLQSKFNLLGVLLIVFSLLMLPMFNQVKADTRDSMKEAKNTWMSKMFRDISRDFKPRNVEDTEVEDYWAEQAKKQDPDCGEACDPNADRDGDGMSNGDEVRAGRNPSCDEDKLGTEYCKGQDPYNLTEPDPVVERVERSLVLNHTITFGTGDCHNGEQLAASMQCRAPDFELPAGNHTSMECYVNTTRFTGTQWSLQVGGPESYLGCSVTGQFGTGGSQGMRSDRRLDPPEGTYTTTLEGQTVRDGQWHIMVWATRVVK